VLPQSAPHLAKRTLQPVADKKSGTVDGSSTLGVFVKEDETSGPRFAPLRTRNQVEFYTTGNEYFEAVATAIEGARKCVFVAGWQINFDVILKEGKRLWDCLKTATDRGCRVYVMPWLSPKVGVDTGDFETMLAVFQLNAGRPGPRLAHCLPAIQQSDQNYAGIAFSHHQKLVVIDNERAFVGGIDLAYGRADDATFSLTCSRDGNERYNPGIPAIRELTPKEQDSYLTRGELIAACFLPRAASDVVNWWNSETWFSPYVRAVAEFRRGLADKASGAAPKSPKRESDSLFGSLSDDLHRRIEDLNGSASAAVSDKLELLLAWLNNGQFDGVPSAVIDAGQLVAQQISMYAYHLFAAGADQQSALYERLASGGKILPPGGRMLDVARQPRQPWQDVQVSVTGEAVYDLAMNFVRRWNAAQHRLHADFRWSPPDWLVALFGGIRPPARPKPDLIPEDLLPQLKPGGSGKVTIQVCRSAPARLRADERKAMPGLGLKNDTRPERGCLNALVNTIHAAQHFLYIEGQFFQSGHGPEGAYRQDLVSGPMGELTRFEAVPGFAKYRDRFNLAAAAAKGNPALIFWDQVLRLDDPEFIAGLKRVAANIAQREVSGKLAPAQRELLNPVGLALAERITRAIYDGLPFHVYLVLPVHPEGRLDTLNILHQVHLTQQSLIFGEQSLVNRIRRALIARRLVKESKGKLSLAAAQQQVAALELDAVEKEQGWQDYLTLLNLRNWALLGGRPVTEQIYVHSKLLIADDRIAVLGSANINDRSLLGDRDSELAVLMHDGDEMRVPLDGKHAYPVGRSIHTLRVELWRKHFGLSGGGRPAKALASVLERPAAAATWKSIQNAATKNLRAYAEAFAHVPRDVASDAQAPDSIWPVWAYPKGHPAFDKSPPRPQPIWAGGLRKHHMPFDEGFWHDAKRANLVRAGESAPMGIQGFITALPIDWTRGENNVSGLNLLLVAQVGEAGPATTAVAAAPVPLPAAEKALT